ncbi:MAG: hypothetical protein QXR57_03500 [Metallosphaera sp.]|uniref:hypothetical protein n=1 Tax=Metallosphaera sp. TaxID=2020860 RepID=UPI003163095E
MIENALSELNPLKTLRNDLGECVMYYVELKDLGEFLIFEFQGKTNYVKVMRPFPGRWSCDSALYNPRGLYVFDLGKGITGRDIISRMEAISKWSQTMI